MVVSMLSLRLAFVGYFALFAPMLSVLSRFAHESMITYHFEARPGSFSRLHVVSVLSQPCVDRLFTRIDDKSEPVLERIIDFSDELSNFFDRILF